MPRDRRARRGLRRRRREHRGADLREARAGEVLITSRCATPSAGAPACASSREAAGDSGDLRARFHSSRWNRRAPPSTRAATAPSAHAGAGHRGGGCRSIARRMGRPSLGAFGVALTSASPPASSVQPSAMGNVASATPRASVEEDRAPTPIRMRRKRCSWSDWTQTSPPTVSAPTRTTDRSLPIDAETARAFGVTLEERVARTHRRGVRDTEHRGPDSFHLWETRRIIDSKRGRPGGVDPQSGWRRRHSPRRLLRWQPGLRDGRLATSADGFCAVMYGDAVIEWSYDGRALYGTASRRDGDLDSLLRWWAAEARLDTSDVARYARLHRGAGATNSRVMCADMRFRWHDG